MRATGVIVADPRNTYNGRRVLLHWRTVVLSSYYMYTYAKQCLFFFFLFSIRFYTNIMLRLYHKPNRVYHYDNARRRVHGTNCAVVFNGEIYAG